MKWNVKKLAAIFSHGDMRCRLAVHGFHLGYRKLITRICPNVRNAPFHSQKQVSCFFGKYWFSGLPITWLLIKWLACHMTSRSQRRVAAIMTSLSWHHLIIMTSLIVPSPRWRILKTIDIGKNIPEFCHQFIHVRACITKTSGLWALIVNVLLIFTRGVIYFSMFCMNYWKHF